MSNKSVIEHNERQNPVLDPKQHISVSAVLRTKKETHSGNQCEQHQRQRTRYYLGGSASCTPLCVAMLYVETENEQQGKNPCKGPVRRRSSSRSTHVDVPYKKVSRKRPQRMQASTRCNFDNRAAGLEAAVDMGVRAVV